MTPRSSKESPPGAFTLIELLVALAIIGLLLALLLPAVQRVRDAAARADCQNRMKQLGLALRQYHDGYQTFPNGWRSGVAPLGTTAAPMSRPWSGWTLDILPYLEQSSLAQTSDQAYRSEPNPFDNPPHVGLATVVPAYLCPSDGRVVTPHAAPKNGRVIAFTSYLGVSGQNWSTHDGVLFQGSQVRLTDITDGSSNTLLVGERPPSADFQFGWWYAGSGQLLSGSGDILLGVREQNLLPVTPTSCSPGRYSFAAGSFANQCDLFHFWSPHNGGANFAFADGSVHFLKYAAGAVLPALASRSGGEAASALD